MAGNWPLIGRNDELDTFTAALDNPNATGLVLVGAAGVGKTRLAAECLHLASERGDACTRVVASRSASSIPYGAIAPLLPPGLIALEQGLTALRQVTIALSQLADGRRLVMTVDDAHSLDEASAVLLEQLAATRAAFLIVTIRSGERPPEPITALWKDHGLERITIDALDRSRADHFATTMLGEDVDEGALGQLWAKSEGNPMFLRELVLGAVQDGSLVSERGSWKMHGELGPSDRLTELVGARLTGLSNDEIEALEYVALGEPIGLDLTARLCDPDAMESVERSGLVVLQRDGRRSELRLAHPMYGEVLRARTPAIRARSVSRRLAEAVEQTGALRREDPLRVSLWRIDGGGVPPLALLEAGAAQALFAHEFDIARRLAHLAFETAPSFGSGMLLLDVLYQANRTDESSALFDRVLPLAADDRQRAEAAVMYATSLFWKTGDVERAIAVMEAALHKLGDSVERNWLLAFRALVEVQAGHSALAFEMMEPLLESDEPLTFVRASLSASLAISILGRCLDAVELSDRAISTRKELGAHTTLFETGLLMVAKAVALNEAGRIDEAYEVAAFTRLLAADTNDVSSIGFCGIALARICLSSGKLREAAAWAETSISAFRAYGHPGPLRWALGYLGLAWAWLGELRDAADVLGELDVLPPHPAGMLDVDIERARAWIAVGTGELEAARSALAELADRMRSTGQHSFEATVLFDLARLGDARQVTQRLAEIASFAQGDLYAAMSAAASASATGGDAELGLAAERMIELGAQLFAAELAVAASEGHRRDGDQRRAAEWARRATDLIDACGGPRTPGLVQVDAPVPLTQRERDVALLAAQGMTSKMIGERLYVASRTVDNHLARIYMKLGVSNRIELASLLGVDPTSN